MQLARFRVTTFRNVVDSGWVAVDEAITCLVGKNEAGKSALLEALALINPSDSTLPDLASQYPTWLLARARRVGDPSRETVIRAEFVLDDEDLRIARDALGDDVLRKPRVEVSRRYNGKLSWTFDIDERPLVEALVKTSDTSLPKAVREANTLKELDAALDEAFRSYEPDAPQRGRLQGAADHRSGVEHKSGSQIVADALFSRVPVFFRFSELDVMPGVVDLAQIAGDGTDGPGEGGLQAARALVRLAESGAGALGDTDYEARKRELNTVSMDLTNQVFEYWKQNPALRVEVDIDAVEGTDRQGTNIVSRQLHLRVRDDRTGYSNNFHQRSSGFRWFFSFLASFSAFEARNEPVVILLDEPGLSLHGRAQADFLRFIEERLSPVGQVVYTTHSPFMVEVGRLERVRTVEEGGPPDWVTVHNDVGANDPDSLFPLQAALGYDIAQSLFIGPDNLVVEGISDMLYLLHFSDLLQAEGRAGLDEAWRILPGGGATNIPTFVALVGPHLDVTVLVDSGQRRLKRIEGAIADSVLKGSRLIDVAKVLGLSAADIEDIFVVDDYLALFNAAMGTSVAEADLGSSSSRVIERLKGSHGGFNHRVPANYLVRHQSEFTFSETTLSNFETLINHINATKGT